ncbi:DNA polymerase III subunit epsilon [Corynebacterium sp.]|uniref:DNA polymerase III subunit epsilon n=1 Tax=Corynebacterium sp. TaxID=1720 RepID=UPI002A909B7D|nr:DNA polymerase III subunit epsilon [Corynebacterium sp.]MDY5786392.1 DNA polymerase III subunit epsilon [Corynebacterium sp.]
MSTPPAQHSAPDTPDTEAFAFVAVHVQATGIHPSTGRLLTIDAVTFNEDGEIGEEFHAVFNPGGDPGPRHTHGRDASDFAQAPKFSRHLKTLDRLIDARTLIVHDSPLVWGFIVSEARRAMNAAARANRSRNRRNGRRRQRVGHVPRPTEIVDTLDNARRLGVIPTDIRLPAIATALGMDAPSPVASVERAGRAEDDTSREETLLLVDTFLELRERDAATGYAPEELAPDRFGLQRSVVRVDAANAPRGADNPGAYTPERGLVAGMEIVVTDDLRVHPDEVIAAATEHDLNYVEKLSRETSLVVSDALEAGAELTGKAMHAHRKGIPVLSGEEFLAAASQPPRRGDAVD